MTTHTVSPYIAFNGQARQALEFYASVFGGTPRFMTFGDSGITEMGPADGIMHGELTMGDGFILMAADSTAPGEEVVRGGMNLVVHGTDADTLSAQFAKMAEHGTVNMELKAQPWGDTYGDLTDQFGISWGFNIAQG